MSSIKILYVDDDETLLQVTKAYISNITNNQVEIMTCISAVKALENLVENKFDVIVSDFQMPEMDGLEFLKTLKRNEDRTPFIIFTGRGREEVIIDALNLGADYYLQKGGDPKSQFAELLDFIYKLIHRNKIQENLRKSQQQLKSQLQGTPIPMYIWEKQDDGDFILATYNNAIFELNTIDENVLKNIKSAEFYKDNLRLYDLLNLSYENKLTITEELDYIIAKSDEYKYIRFQSVFIPPNQVLVTKVDLTSHKVFEKQNQRLLKQQEAINDLAIALGEEDDLKEIYRIIFKHLQAIMEAATLAISFYDSEKEQFTAGFVITDGKELDVSKFPPIPLNKEKGKGTQSQVIHTGKIYYAEDLQKALDSSKTYYTYTKDGSIYKGRVTSETKIEDIAKSSVYVPMKIRGKIIGVLNIQNFEIAAFKEIDLDILSTFTNVAAIGIQNARLNIAE